MTKLIKALALGVLIASVGSIQALSVEGQQHLDQLLRDSGQDSPETQRIFDQLVRDLKRRVDNMERSARELVPFIHRLESEFERQEVSIKTGFDKLSKAEDKDSIPYLDAAWLARAEKEVLSYCCKLQKDRNPPSADKSEE